MIRRLMCAVMALALGGGSAFAGETDVLIQKLVEKGVLTPNEAQIIMDETRQEVAKQNAKGTNEAVPAWVQTIKMKGDLRARYQSQQREGSTVQNRGRVRFRLGAEAKPNDQVTVGAGFSSSDKSAGNADDSRSTNATLGKNGSTRGSVRLDYAFGEYKPNTDLGLIAGKYNALGRGYLWYTTDMMWDSDINQEGASLHAQAAPLSSLDLFANTGFFSLSESSSDAADAFMAYGQGGLIFNPEPVKVTLAGTYYRLTLNDSNTILGERPSSIPTGAGNTVSSTYVYSFQDLWSGSAEAVMSWPDEGSFPIKMAGIFGDYVVNPDPSSLNTGWAAGVKMGHKKLAELGTWQLKYQYVKLGKDAWLDSFPDSDRFSGLTNAKGHEIMLDLGLMKNVSLGFDYYRSELIKAANKLPEDLFQVDINMKF